jgi:preprotein translocase subunit SecG
MGDEDKKEGGKGPSLTGFMGIGILVIFLGLLIAVSVYIYKAYKNIDLITSSSQQEQIDRAKELLMWGGIVAICVATFVCIVGVVFLGTSSNPGASNTFTIVMLALTIVVTGMMAYGASWNLEKVKDNTILIEDALGNLKIAGFISIGLLIAFLAFLAIGIFMVYEKKSKEKDKKGDETEKNEE